MTSMINIETSDGLKLPPLTSAQTREIYFQLVDLFDGNCPPVFFDENPDWEIGNEPQSVPLSPLKGVPIDLLAAVQKYPIDADLLMRWVQRGYVARLSQGHGNGSPIILDEADVAYLAEVYTS